MSMDNNNLKLARDATSSQTNWFEGDTEHETCLVCYGNVSPNDKFEVQGCFHRICVTCMRKPFSSEQILRGNTAICPYPDCENDLVPEDCRGFADDNAITIMIQRKKEKAIPVKDRVYCPNPCCSFLMSDLDLNSHLGNNNPRQLSEARKCKECGLSFCKKCHVPWHHKKTCDEFKNSESYLKSDAALLESFVKTQGWKKCPQCQSIVQHGGGCIQMTCRHCKHEFCYTCRAACKKKKLTCKCSRSGK
ncbi:probable E3 ubiquitin-protein ligase RNF144A [Capsella rubella]|nr:probable E3 ubiquitin-protein ligase RNF144A [Capsella rubella]